MTGFNCLSIYMSHDDTVICDVCNIDMCKKCNLHYFWASNNRDVRKLYCPVHLNQKHGKQDR